MITRRNFLRTMSGSMAAVPFMMNSPARAGDSKPSGKAPNIVVILADDMGFSDLGCYGSEIATPNLDRLAGEGIRFTHAYNVARCCPTRASLLTGLYPHQAGMGGMVSTADKPQPAGPYQGYLNQHCITMAEALGSAGYRTYMSGKWHVGEKPEHWPRKRGFDRYYGLISGASSYFEILPEEQRTRTMVNDDTPFLPEGDHFYMTDAFTDQAVKYIEEHNDPAKPFLLYLAYTAPHWPLHAWPEDIARYKEHYQAGWDTIRRQRYERQLKTGIIDPKWKLSPRDEAVPAWEQTENKEDWALRMAVYAAMVDRMDQGVGRVLDTLRKLGAEKDTLVLFMSDNGGCHESVEARKLNKPGTQPGERGSFVACEKPWANVSNTPFRWFKHWVHEGGIASPLIARWPGHVQQPGSLTNQVAHVTDIMATVLDASGVEYPRSFNGNEITPLIGRSLLPVLDGKSRVPHDRLCWEHMGNRAIRKENWKMVATAKNEWELYDLDSDRTELNNLSGSEPKKARQLLKEWNNWAERCGVNKKGKKT